MKSYLISTITDFIDAPIALVYSIVTDNSNFQWREEVKDIELLEEGFIEYYKAGGHTLFSNIRKIENEYYAFTMQHKLFIGEWEGKFESYKGGTKICFQEKIHIKNFFLIWHILISYFTHSYSPVMVTCLIGVYLIPKWIYQVVKK